MSAAVWAASNRCVPAVAAPGHAAPSRPVPGVACSTGAGRSNGGAVVMRTRSINGTEPTGQHVMILDDGTKQAGRHGDAYSSTFAGARDEAPQEQDVVRSIVLPPSTDPPVVRFVLASDTSPAQEDAAAAQGGRDVLQGGAGVTLVGDASNYAPTTGYTTSFTRIQVVESGGSSLARVDQLSMQPHVELLTQHVRGTLGVPVYRWWLARYWTRAQA